jgi:hypothetical protein
MPLKNMRKIHKTTQFNEYFRKQAPMRSIVGFSLKKKIALDQVIKKAIIFDNVKLIKSAIKSGAVVNDIDLSFTDFLHKRKLEIIRVLLENGINVNNFNFYDAIKAGDLSIVKLLVDFGANIFIYNNLAIALASALGHLEIVKYLIGQGAPITSEAKYNAAASNRWNVVKFFIENGTNANNESFLYYATIYKDIEMIKYFLELGTWPYDPVYSVATSEIRDLFDNFRLQQMKGRTPQCHSIK